MAQKKKKKKKTQQPQPAAVRMEPVTNPELKEAIDALKGEDPQNKSIEKQQALLEALKNARLLAPVNLGKELKPDANGRLPQVRPNEIRFYLINTKDGKTFFPAFTSIEDAGKFNVTGENDPKPVNIVRTMPDYWNLLSQKDCIAEGVVINPGSDNMIIPKGLAAAAAGKIQMRPAPQKQPENAPVNVIYTEPSVYPTRMINAVYDCCAEIPEIDRVWMKGKVAGMTMTFAFFVEADKNDETILNRIIETAVPLAKEVPVEAEFINDRIMKDIIKDAVALYDRALEL